jgi:uncharacterized protein YbjT (DUF2867 family)
MTSESAGHSLVQGAGTQRRKVLVIGATGFVGPALVDELTRAGHVVVCGVRDLQKAARQLPFPNLEFLEVDMNRDLEPQIWLQRLRKTAVTGVVNNVGIANSFGGQSIENVNVHAPIALFKAVRLYCQEKGWTEEKASLCRTIQVSTTGCSWVDCQDFDYPRTKRITDEALAAMPDLDFVIIRPNIIYEPERGHLVLEQIARIPVIFYVGCADIQPIHCRELALGIVRLLQATGRVEPAILEANGPEIMTWKEVFRQAKEALGRRSGIYLPVQLRLAQFFTLLIQLLPERVLYRLGILSKMDPQTIVMMTRGSTGSNREWLARTGLRPLRLRETYLAYKRGPRDYGEMIEALRKEYISREQ